MNCPKIYKKSEKGFSIVEMIVVVALFIIFISASEWAFFNFQSRSNLDLATANLVEALRHAKANAQQVQQDSKWGVEISNSQATVFSGSSYATRNTSLDQTVSLTSGVTASGLTEVVFEKVSGATLTQGTITLSNTNGTDNIVINAKGTVTY